MLHVILGTLDYILAVHFKLCAEVTRLDHHHQIAYSKQNFTTLTVHLNFLSHGSDVLSQQSSVTS
uniref:Uncharacterized protein n=1 Tax=Arion vulgaris TaxID=1028688 RepID=A0A0B7B7M9_9EUPU